MGMAAILFTGAEPFEKIDNTPSKEDPMRNLMKSGRLVSEKKDFIPVDSPGARANNLGEEIFIVTKRFYCFNHTL